MADSETLKRVRAALELDDYVDIHHHPIDLDLEDGRVVLRGEVGSPAGKTMALAHAREAAGPQGFVDRLKIEPITPQDDEEIRESLLKFFLEDPTFRDCALRAWDSGHLETLRDPPGSDRLGDITILVQNGVITLEGRVVSLTHKRLAGVLAWWTRGRREVLNAIEVTPPQEDRDPEITDAVRQVLGKDPMVDEYQVRIDTRDGVVTLQGFVPNEEEKRRAEYDTWCVLGVRRVDNRITASGP